MIDKLILKNLDNQALYPILKIINGKYLTE
jgi:hypothetical protein